MSIPYALQGIFQTLPSNTQSLVLHDYEVRKKSAFFAYFFWFFFGFHYLYLGRISIQLLYWLTIGGFGFWMLIDLFRIPGMVERKNEDIARELMAQYQAMRVGYSLR
ncbi:MAG: TM2 domain-containing protein [Acidobacteriaceae bacterium]